MPWMQVAEQKRQKFWNQTDWGINGPLPFLALVTWAGNFIYCSPRVLMSRMRPLPRRVVVKIKYGDAPGAVAAGHRCSRVTAVISLVPQSAAFVVQMLLLPPPAPAPVLGPPWNPGPWQPVKTWLCSLCSSASSQYLWLIQRKVSLL